MMNISITGNLGDDDLTQEDGTIEQNTGNNNHFLKGNDESESSDEDTDDLFEYHDIYIKFTIFFSSTAINITETT